MLPLYLPMLLDERDSTDCPLFMGGINAFLHFDSEVGLSLLTMVEVVGTLASIEGVMSVRRL